MEWDFQVELNGLNAMDWIARKRDWRQFYRFKNQLGVGSAYWSAQMMNPELAAILAELPTPTPRTTPPMRGFTPLMHALTDVKDQLIALRGAMSQARPNEISFSPRPVSKAEEMKKERSRAKRRVMLSQLLPHQEV